MGESIFMGKPISNWNGNGNEVKTITLCVTEDCNLVCKYCYMTGKNHKKKMSFETAKDIVNFFLNNSFLFSEEAVVWEFIGGEPFLEIDLIDKICDYIKIEMYKHNHKWFNAYRFSFSTNGILYATEKVQKYITKNKSHLSIGISIDGNKEKHDQQRIYKNGKGSYEDVIRNVPLWQKQFPGMHTKATFAHEDIPLLKDSIVSLWNNGIYDVAANVIFENVWQEGDDIILEQQLNELADYVIENKLWDKVSVRFFDKSIGLPVSEENQEKNYCGAGKMIAVDCDGNFYPCIRFLDFSMSNKKGRTIGDIRKGIDKNKLRPFVSLTAKHISKKECLDCEIASGCAWCTGFNYDDAKNDTIFERATYNCKMHKATVRANERFWLKYEKATGKISPKKVYAINNSNKYMHMLLDSNIKEVCDYKKNPEQKNEKMTSETFRKGLNFAIENNMQIVFLGNSDNYDKSLLINNNINFNEINDDITDNNFEKIMVYDGDNDIQNTVSCKNCILMLDKLDIPNLYKNVKMLSEKSNRINIILREKEKWEEIDLNMYKAELNKINNLIIDLYNNGQVLEISTITDRLYLKKHCNCDSGVKNITLGPDGNFYICPAFYYDKISDYLGSLETGIKLSNAKLLLREYSPICDKCDAYHCRRCVYKNIKITGEFNIPCENQCLVSNYEKEATVNLYKLMLDNGNIESKTLIYESGYIDPLNKLIQ